MQLQNDFDPNVGRPGHRAGIESRFIIFIELIVFKIYTTCWKY